MYKGILLLGATLESILRQTRPPAEVIVVDDGSPEDIESVVASLQHPALRYIRTANRGCNAARNTGADASKSRWLAFCDADDIWLPQKLARQMALLHEAPECEYCICDYRPFNEEGFVTRSHFGYAPPGFWDCRPEGPGTWIRDRAQHVSRLPHVPAGHHFHRSSQPFTVRRNGAMERGQQFGAGSRPGVPSLVRKPFAELALCLRCSCTTGAIRET